MQGCSPKEANNIRRKFAYESWRILQRYLPSQKVLLSSSQMKPTFEKRKKKHGERKLRGHNKKELRGRR